MEKLKAAIIGPGNIGTDLLIKALRSEEIEPTWMIGVDPQSPGLARARELGLRTTDRGIDGLLEGWDDAPVDICFDATSAYAHERNAEVMQQRGVVMIDLTPAALGPFCVPPVNLDAALQSRAMNVNMVTCGGQATIPMVAAISRVQSVEYAEIVATVSSRSAGPGTRKNIDEFTRTTARAIELIGGAESGKAIIIINPAEPPLIMRDTVHCLTREAPEEAEIRASVAEMISSVQRYVPGYRLKNGPVIDGNRVSVYLEVEGLGDFLPRYAGNLDIMTSAALQAAEHYAREIRSGRFIPHAA